MGQAADLSYHLRVATASDIGEIARIWGDGKAPSDDTIRELEMALSDGQDGSSVMVAESDEGPLLGFVKYNYGMVLHGMQLAPYVEKVGVVPSARRRGVGRDLLAAAIDDIRQSGGTAVECDAISKEGRSLVNRLGFRRDGPNGPDTLSLG